MFLGSASTSTITAQSVVAEATGDDSATAGIGFLADGRQTIRANDSITVVGNWVVPSSTAAEWEIRAVLNSGITPTTGAIGTWLALTSDRNWALTSSLLGDANSLLTFEFRKVGGSSAEVTISGSSLTAITRNP